MFKIPADLRKTHKLARRALSRAKESARVAHMMPDDATVRTPKRDRKAWHRLGMRSLILIVSLASIPPAMAHGGNHGHLAGSASVAFHSHMTGH